MDPCPFVRLIVESLALKLPAVSKPAGPGIHPSSNPCFCTLHFHDSSPSSQTAPLPLASSDDTSTAAEASSSSSSSSVVFSLDPAALQRLAGKPTTLTVAVFAGRRGTTCGFSTGRLIGRVRVGVDLESPPSRAVVMQSGWLTVGHGASAARLHLVVRSEPDPRFVFQFGGEPECSPVVFQIQGSHGSRRSGCLQQPIFSCRFSAGCRRSTGSRSLPFNSSGNGTIKGWLGAFGIERDKQRREQRKGWTVTIHDLSGSPVAAASMVTPFVPSPGLDRVTRSNPGAWLILQAAGFSPTNWTPWGRLEAWRERGPTDALGYRFELVMDGGPSSGGVLIAQSSLSARKGGRFCIDPSAAGDAAPRPWPFVGGFVMASTVEGEGRVSKPAVQVGVQHVTCMADAALFVALAAAVDLSMDACQLFSQKLRKELCHDNQQERYHL